MQNDHAFRPAGGNIGGGERMEKLPFEPFQADATTDLPNAGQFSHYFALVFPTPSSLAQPSRLPTMPENSDSVLALITDCSYKFVQDACFSRSFWPSSTGAEWFSVVAGAAAPRCGILIKE